MDPVSLITVIIAALSSSVVKEAVKKVWEKYRDSLTQKVGTESVTIVGPNGSKISVDPTKPVSNDELRKITT
jgi:hypothetical protein